nr:MAG TPA: hypothetical protein [Caudoviricetes sp.]
MLYAWGAWLIFFSPARETQSILKTLRKEPQ